MQWKRIPTSLGVTIGQHYNHHMNITYVQKLLNLLQGPSTGNSFLKGQEEVREEDNYHVTSHMKSFSNLACKI